MGYRKAEPVVFNLFDGFGITREGLLHHDLRLLSNQHIVHMSAVVIVVFHDVPARGKVIGRDVFLVDGLAV